MFGALPQDQVSQIRTHTFKIVLGIGGILVLAYWCWPALEEDAEATPQTACVQNLSQLMVATSLYTADHDGALPTESWMDDLQTYVKDDRAFQCPSYDGHYGYAANINVVGKKMSQFSRSDEPIYFDVNLQTRNAVADPKTTTLPSRHEKDGKMGYNISTSNGSAIFVLAKVK